MSAHDYFLLVQLHALFEALSFQLVRTPSTTCLNDAYSCNLRSIAPGLI